MTDKLSVLAAEILEVKGLKTVPADLDRSRKVVLSGYFGAAGPLQQQNAALQFRRKLRQVIGRPVPIVGNARSHDRRYAEGQTDRGRAQMPDVFIETAPGSPPVPGGARKMRPAVFGPLT